MATKAPAAVKSSDSKVGSGRVVATIKKPAAVKSSDSKVGSGRVVATIKKPAAVKSSDSKVGFGRFKEAITEAKNAVIDQTNVLLDHTKAGKIAKGVGNQAADLAGKVLGEAAAVSKKIGGNLSGAEVQAKIGELVEQQRRYNDILATRLAEALGRIEKLESQLARRTRGR